MPQPLLIQELLDRMRAGDRGAAAAFITEFGPQIRRRIRGKMNPAMRRIFDSMEIMSTVGRRLDLYVRNQQLRATEEKELWGLVWKIADHAVIDKARIYKRLRRVESGDEPVAEALRSQVYPERDDGAVAIELEQAIEHIAAGTNRQILTLWLGGKKHCEIAETLEISYEAERQRWQTIRKQLRAHFLATTDIEG